jgi:hypothetical protein
MIPQTVPHSPLLDVQSRFESFIQTIPGYENIDALMQAMPPDQRHRADYLLMNRRFIVEQKVLLVEPAKSPQAFVQRLLRERRLFVTGKTTTRRVFDSLPDGKALERKMLLGMTKNFEDRIDLADEQARDTRQIFGIPDALAIVVILNQSARTLHPELLRYGLSHLLSRTARDGSPRYPHNDGFLVISASHSLMDDGGAGMPVFADTSQTCRSVPDTVAFLDSLVGEWSRYNGLPIKRYEH